MISGCGSVSLSQLTPDTATCTTTYSGPVDDAVQAVYSGDSLFAGSSNYVDTTTTLTSSDDGSAVAGETVTYSATVADTNGGATPPVPTGTVTFSDTASDIASCSAQSLELVGSNEVATCSVTYPTVLSSPDAVAATYNGDTATFGSTTSLDETVDQASTTTSLSSSDDGSAVVGEQVTFTATVGVVAPGSGIPTGTVTFSDSAGAIAGCTGVPLSGGSPDTATCQATYSTTMMGPDAISATYSGDSSYLTSTASSFAESVNPASTTTALSKSAPSVVVGQPVTITAKIGVVAPGSGIPTGSVAFSDSAGVIGAACPSQSVGEVGGALKATCTVSFPAALTSTDVIGASYSGDTNFAGSTAPTLDLDVDQASTTTGIATSDATPVVGEAVTYTATIGIASPGVDVPTGTVEFVGDSGTISACGAAPLSATAPFVATCTVPYGSPGTDSVNAAYSGDANNLGSSSSSVAETIGKDSTTTTLSATPDPAVSGETTVLSATVLVNTPGSSTPSGTVTFYQGAKVLCAAAAVSDGAARCSISYAKATSSPYELTAVYSGDANELGSTSVAISLSVSHATHLNLSVTPSPANYAHRITFHAGGLPAAATGTITFSVGSSELCSLPVSNGGATCIPTSPLAPGSYTIIADYSGDANYAPATASASLTVVIAPTAITLRPEPASSAYGTPVALVAGNIPGLATGTVTFSVAGSVVCTEAAASPSVSFALSTFTPGTYAVTAAYSGDANFAPSNASASLTVRKATAHFTASATPPSAVDSQNVTLNASDLPSNATGTVSFTTGSTALCSATVSGGLASCGVPAGLSAHTYHVTAHYSGDTNYDSATATTSFAVTS